MGYPLAFIFTHIVFLNAPVKFAPVKSEFFKSLPDKSTWLRLTLLSEGGSMALVKFALVKFAPVEFEPVKFAPVKFAPVTFAPVRSLREDAA